MPVYTQLPYENSKGETRRASGAALSGVGPNVAFLDQAWQDGDIGRLGKKTAKEGLIFQLGRRAITSYREMDREGGSSASALWASAYLRVVATRIPELATTGSDAEAVHTTTVSDLEGSTILSLVWRHWGADQGLMLQDDMGTNGLQQTVHRTAYRRCLGRRAVADGLGRRSFTRRRKWRGPWSRRC